MKKRIVDELKSVGLSGVEAEYAFRQVSEAMARMVRRGDRVRIPGIGTLTRKTRAATRRRNPRTGEPIIIGERDVVALHNPEKF